MRHLNDVHVFAAGKACILIGKDVQLTATRANFFNVRFQFFQQFVVRCDHDNRHISINQRQRTVLQFACGICFSVNIRDLFQLQRAFQRDGVLIATAKEQRMVFVRETFRQSSNALVLRQHLLNTTRQRLQTVNDLLLNRRIQAFQTRQFRHQHQQNSQLGGKCLRGGHTDFGTGIGHHRQVRFTHQRGARNVTDSQRSQIAQLFR